MEQQKRFIFKPLDEIDDAERQMYGIDGEQDPNEDWAYTALLDTQTKRSWVDGGEPEDQYFRRDWNWVLGLVNELAEENAVLRAATDQFLKDAPDLQSPDFYLKQAAHALLRKLVALKQQKEG